MNQDIFDTCLAFHKALIRSKLLQRTIDNAKIIMVDGEQLINTSAQDKSRAKAMVSNINRRLDALKDFHSASWDERYKIYCDNCSRTPSKQAFEAVDLCINHSYKIGTAAAKVDVNHQNVKSLKPRVERFINHAKKINDLMTME